MEYEPQKVRPGHDAIVDAVLANPKATAVQVAASTGYSVEYCRVLMRSDAFQERLAERRGELVDPELRLRIETRLDVVAGAALDEALARLESGRASENFIARMSDVVLKAKGLGARVAEDRGPQVVVVVPGKSATPLEWIAEHRPPNAAPVVGLLPAAGLRPGMVEGSREHPQVEDAVELSRSPESPRDGSPDRGLAL